MPTVKDFRIEIAELIRRATKQGRPEVEINAGELHRSVGGYPPKAGENHSMPSCCDAMRDEFGRGSAEILYETDSGNSASFTIRYHLPRMC